MMKENGERIKTDMKTEVCLHVSRNLEGLKKPKNT